MISEYLLDAENLSVDAEYLFDAEYHLVANMYAQHEYTCIHAPTHTHTHTHAHTHTHTYTFSLFTSLSSSSSLNKQIKIYKL